MKTLTKAQRSFVRDTLVEADATSAALLEELTPLTVAKCDAVLAKLEAVCQELKDAVQSTELDIWTWRKRREQVVAYQASGGRVAS